MSQVSLPIVDFAPFLDGSDKGKVATELIASLRGFGFVYLTNYGLSKEKVDKMFDWSKKFFSSPEEVKQLVPHPASGAHHRGYSAPGREKVGYFDPDDLKKNLHETVDIKESFDCGRDNDLLMPNVWLPDGVLPGFNEACLEFFWLCYDVEKTVLRALALGFSLSEDYLLALHTTPDNQLRLLHYPSVLRNGLETGEIGRLSAHTDFDSITLLFQDSIGGLEIEDPKSPGTFIAVPPVQDALVLNAGDLLARWANDTIRSTVHRVRAPPDTSRDVNGLTPPRYSIPYFCAANFDEVVDCLPGTFSEERPKRYEATSTRDFILSRLAATY